MTMASEQIIFKISHEDKEAFRCKAEENGTNASVLLRQWIKAYIQDKNPRIKLLALQKDIEKLAAKYGLDKLKD